MENKGFTLIEVLIVIAIIGILAAIALPSYQAHVRKGNRIDMQLAMTEMSLVAERQYARQNTYPADAADTGVKTPSSYNTVFASSAAVGTTPATFLITATPKPGQASDDCGVMTLNQAGTTSASLATCW